MSRRFSDQVLEYTVDRQHVLVDFWLILPRVYGYQGGPIRQQMCHHPYGSSGCHLDREIRGTRGCRNFSLPDPAQLRRFVENHLVIRALDLEQAAGLLVTFGEEIQ